MSSWARPGVKCVCVDASNWNATDERSLWWAELPVEGGIYVVREVVNFDGGTGLRLVGINNPLIPCVYGEIAFSASRFRPLITKTQEQDLAVFREWLKDLPLGVDA